MTNELYHHGILGQKWGVRRYQNEDGSLTNAGKKRYYNEMSKDMNQHFKSQISKEAAKVTSIGRNGYDQRGSAWNDAYRSGKVTSKDDAEIRKAAKNTREYMKQKYGEDAVKKLAQTNAFSTKVPDLKATGTDLDKLINNVLNPVIPTERGPMRFNKIQDKHGNI